MRFLTSSMLATFVLAVFAVAVLHSAGAQPAKSTPAQQIERGKSLAQTWCSRCHLVDDAAAGGGAVAPSFAAIARSEKAPPAYLRTFLQTPHARMPDLQLTRTEIDDLVAYLLAQKQ